MPAPQEIFGDFISWKSLRVIRRKTWGKKSNRKKVTGQRRRGRVNIMGGLRYHDKKRINFVIEEVKRECLKMYVNVTHQ
ncbi:MAG: hypothetical protein AN482_18935 [Anabaena sp. LE011-02]|jgi:DDE superfamily endonuclease|nr:MAG: hypothetical protein AN482_18935 [Anabaena sp. LE011-02]